MPEILEVETYRTRAEAVVDRRITAVQVPDAWYVKRGTPADVEEAARGRTVRDLHRRGKLLVLHLAADPVDDAAGRGEGPDEVRLGLRFGMTGRLIVDGTAAIDRLEHSSPRDDPAWDRFGLTFAGGTALTIRDPRRLGGVELAPDEDRLGVDALTMTTGDLAAALGTSTAPLKARLLDQTRIAGIGNLLADEVLWRAGLDPTRPAGSLTADETARLHRTARSTLQDLAERGGSHTGDLRAAATSGRLCPRDGTPLARLWVGGRTTLHCPLHQT